jgi:hypothetical protein
VNFRLPLRTQRIERDGSVPLLTRLNARGIRLLQPADAIVLYLLMVAINVGRFGFSWPDYPLSHYIIGFATATAIHLAVFYFGGLYERELRLGHRPRLPRLLALTSIAVLLCGAAALMTGRYLLPRANLVVLLLLGAIAVAVNRRVARWLRRQREGPPRVLLVGAPDEVNLARKQLATEEDIVVSGEAAAIEGLVERVEETGSTEVLLLSSRMLDDLYPEPLSTLEERGLGVLQVVSPRDSLLGLRNVRELGGMPFVALYSHVMSRSQMHLKRSQDLLLCLLLAPFLLLLLGLVAAYVRIAAGPPVLYRQTRVGQEGREFELVKFRTMYPGPRRRPGPCCRAPTTRASCRRCGGCGRPAWTSCRSCGTSCAARCPWSGHARSDPSSPSASPCSSPGTRGGSRSPPVSPGWPRSTGGTTPTRSTSSATTSSTSSTGHRSSTCRRSRGPRGWSSPVAADG